MAVDVATVFLSPVPDSLMCIVLVAYNHVSPSGFKIEHCRCRITPKEVIEYNR